MTEAATSFEALLREALTPVEPPADLAERLEGALQSITEMAADELEWAAHEAAMQRALMTARATHGKRRARHRMRVRSGAPR